ncbi:3-sulfolactaldehyde dehydrogenase [Chelonus insularis]|uniref:3-sulfolactaldehyde dehydrogenase n=1 Tax=Chelonus insularis TaxID=460826 RepID=UPI001588B271|nr:3-sulfolactaldehyde dehydrogenase [Chelonus insularis]
MLTSKRFLIHFKHAQIIRNMSLLKNMGYINGKWVPAMSGVKFDVLNPVNQSVIAQVPDMNVEDTKLAIDAASKAFKTFSKTTAKERSDLLRSWYNLMVKHSEELAEILTKENGKSLAESRAEIKYGNSFVEWFSEEARRINGEILPAPLSNRKLMILKQPAGVSALITPWNFPHAMITRKAGAAIAAGCTCVIKPSEDTPLTALALIKLAEEAGFPAGVLNVITTNTVNSPSVGKAICDDARVRVLSFTGSTAVGKILYNQCASTMKKLSLELGGNAPFIVFNSAKIDLAINGAMVCKFRNTGQTCVSANRFYVQNKVFQEFVDKFIEKISRDIKLGDGLQTGITHGPLIKASQIQMVEHLVEDAVAKGAKLHCGGKKLDTLGPLFYAPTVLTGVTKDMDIYHKEIFGPVAVIHQFEHEDQVLDDANSTNVGLAGYFFSEDLSQIFRVAHKMEVGMIGVNEGLISCAEAAFGGVKESGLGREGSKHGIDDYIDMKYVCIGNLDL